MKYIIIHNVEDKQSREFVATYGSREDVDVELDDGGPIRVKYPYISAFPTVIIPVPDYKIYNDDLSYVLITGSLDYIRCPDSWAQVQERIDYWNIRKNF